MSKKLSIIAAVSLIALFVLPVSQIAISCAANSESGGSEGYPSVFIRSEGFPDADVGETFTVIVGVSGLVDNLYGFNIYFRWNSDSLKYVGHDVKTPVETCSDGVLHQPVLAIKDEIEESTGTYWLAYASLSPAEPFNGNGVFFTMTFEVVKLVDDPFTLEDVTLVSYDGKVIPVDGYQNSGTLTSGVPDLHDVNGLWAKRWLEWWITVTLRRG